MKPSKKRIEYRPVNAGWCPDCKDTIISWHVHDFVECSCGKNFVDGGFDYKRRTIGIKDVPLYIRIVNNVVK